MMLLLGTAFKLGTLLDGWKGLRMKFEYYTPLKKGLILQSKGWQAFDEVCHHVTLHKISQFFCCVRSTLQFASTAMNWCDTQ